MLTEPKRIKVSPDSEIARLLEEARNNPVILESNGETYRLYHDEAQELWSGYDSDRARETIARLAGSWSDLDTDKMIAELYQARERGSRPLTRP